MTVARQCPACADANLEAFADMASWLAIARGSGDDRARVLAIAEKIGGLEFGGFDRCAACGFIAVRRYPEPRLLGDFYTAYFGSATYSAKAAKKLRRAGRRIRRLKRHVGPSATFLDVGCNLGFAVEAARRQGLRATGLEIDGEAVMAAKNQFPGCEFQRGRAEDLAAEGRRFDLIYCAEVIEHVPDVDSFASALGALCAPGGRLYLTTPDGGRFAAAAAFLDWREVKPPEHLCWFTRRAMRALLSRHGFGRVRFGFSLKAGLRVHASRT